MRFGNLSLHTISDGVLWEDGGGLFGLVPKVLWQQVWAADDQNRLPLQLYCLLIESPGQRILVDTGYGDKLSAADQAKVDQSGSRGLVGELGAMGLEPPDIDLVINTHLHTDHCGGNTASQDGKLVPAFPQATYCIQRLELADALFPGEWTRSAYCHDGFAPLQGTAQLRLLWGDTRLTDEVRVIVTSGHTRAHQSVIVESGGETAVFLGDVAPWPIHLERLAWVPAWDTDPLDSIETKRRLAHWAIEKKALLIFAHHPEIVGGYLHATDRPDRFRLEPVEGL
jgi:glyoxylase-like metal-dependent hydrolase (beta-lactamase superfamily II)